MKTILVGRDPECDIVLDNGSISRQHAKFTISSDFQVDVQDLGSTNGTFINGARVSTSRLRPGDQVRLGLTTVFDWENHFRNFILSQHSESDQSFAKLGFLQEIGLMFTAPVTGSQAILASANPATHFLRGGILYFFSLVVGIMLPYLLAGKMRGFIPFEKFLLFGFFLILWLALMVGFTTAASTLGRAGFSFVRVFYAGALCSLPLSLLLIAYSLFFVIYFEGFNTSIPSFSVSVALGVVLLLFVMMKANILQQALYVSKTNEALAWYSAPFIVVVSLAIAAKLFVSMVL